MITVSEKTLDLIDDIAMLKGVTSEQAAVLIIERFARKYKIETERVDQSSMSFSKRCTPSN